MNISIWDEIKEWTVSAESLRRRFVQRLEEPGSVIEGPVLYVPSAWDVFASTSESKWLTDITDSSMDGFRIVKMGEWGKLCEIERDGGKIIRNRSLESVKQLPYSVIQTFSLSNNCPTIQHGCSIPIPYPSKPFEVWRDQF